MPNFKITAVLAVAGLAMNMSAFAQTDTSPEIEAELVNTPSTEGVVTDAASCEYEGGSVMDLTDGTICFIPIRGEVAGTKVYDGMKLGVIKCEGNGDFANEVATPNDSYCRIYLTEKQQKKTLEELQREVDEMNQQGEKASN